MFSNEKMKKAFAFIGVLLLTALPVYSQTWQQRNAEAQMKEDMRRETSRQIQQNNEQNKMNQRVESIKRENNRRLGFTN